VRLYYRFVPLLRMFKPLTEREYRRWEARASLAGLAALLSWAAMWYFGPGPGIATSMFAVYLMACFGCFEKRHSEPGLWMLALLTGGMAFTFWALFAFHGIRDMIRGARPSPILISLDILGMTLFLQWAVRLSWTVFCINRRVRAGPR